MSPRFQQETTESVYVEEALQSEHDFAQSLDAQERRR
jgi:hypothetical protein